MEVKTGTLQRIETKVAKTGREYWCLYIDNLKFNTFDAIFGAFKTPSHIEYKIEKNAQGYNTILDMKEIDSSGVKPGGNFDLPHNKSNEYHLTLEQCNSNALASAIEYAKLFKIKQDDFMILVKQFEDYIKGVKDEKQEDNL